MADDNEYLNSEWRDDSVAMADDFFGYANGGWLKNNPIPDEQVMWGSFLEIHERNQDMLHVLLADPVIDPSDASERIAKAYFASGLDEATIKAAGVEPLSEYWNEIDALATNADAAQVFAKLQLIGMSAPFGIQIMPDYENPNKNLLYFGQAGLGLPEKSYYFADTDQNKALREAYIAHIATQLVNFGYAQDKADAAAQTILAFETKLADISYSPEQLRDITLTFKKYPYSELAEALHVIDVDAFMSSIGINAATVSVNNIGFFEGLSTLLETTDTDIVKDYLRWHVIKQFAAALPPEFEQASFDFYAKTLGGQAQQKPRWKRIIDLGTADVGQAIGRVYVKEMFSDESKQRCEELVQNLLASMKESIESLDWMGDETKQAAQVKLKKFGYKIGFPDKWIDYSELAIDSQKSFVTNRVAAIQFEVTRRISTLDEPVDTTEWEMPPHMVNAYYHPLKNEIVFPAGILQPPMFYEAADDAIIYGAIGTVIGHEITHGFDDQGSQFDGEGHKKNWWHDSDQNAFTEKAKKLVEQANSFEALPEKYINGQLTLGENIADLGGVRIALEALRLSKSDKQLTNVEMQQFFLSYATIWRIQYRPEIAALLLNVDTHSPARFRTNGPLSNIEEFADAFTIPVGSNMRRSPDDIIKIW